jgi:hypothetical protein|nr:MAG TPA: PROTEIN/RNA Complex, archaeal, ribosomal, 50S, protein.0A [Caudoviricetes sp.]
MPDEYISRAKALSAVQKQRGANRSPAQNDMLDRICRNIKNMPAADVAEVRHGRWIHHEDGVFTCSECGNAESNDSYYCRLCGAKMDGSAE